TSEVFELITCDLSKEIAEKYRSDVKKGVEDWQPAFEKAGFENAIVCRDAPARKRGSAGSLPRRAESGHADRPGQRQGEGQRAAIRQPDAEGPFALEDRPPRFRPVVEFPLRPPTFGQIDQDLMPRDPVRGQGVDADHADFIRPAPGRLRVVLVLYV